MASKEEFVRYVADQLRDAGEISTRKMFGEYGVYLDGKIFALIFEDQLFVKITEAGKKMRPDLEEKPPYEGAKNYLLVEDIDDREALTEFVRATCRELPAPKPKKPRGSGEKKSAEKAQDTREKKTTKKPRKTSAEI